MRPGRLVLATPFGRLSVAALLGSLWAGAWACSDQKEGRPDEDLGTLVHSAIPKVIEIDALQAAKDPKILLSAVLLPHEEVGHRLGAHKVVGTTLTTALRGNEPVESLSTEMTLHFDSQNQFAATLDNSEDQGRHAIFAEGELFLRPRFGDFHGRAPVNDVEPAEIRNQIFSEAAAYLELSAHELEVSDGGASMLGDRSVHEISIGLSPETGKKPVEELVQRKWRESAKTESLRAIVKLDSETGVALHIELASTVSFLRDGVPQVLKLEATRTITDIGTAELVQKPAPDTVRRIPARHNELIERNRLLDKLAPPARGATPRD